jgi:hypothetical protein
VRGKAGFVSAVPAVSAGMPAPPPVAAEAPPQLSSLPEPEGTPAEPADLLATLLLLMEEQSALTMGATENKIEAARELLKENLEKFLRQLKDALDAARKAKEQEDDGGLFGDIVGCVADIVGDVIGTIVDFVVDAVEMPVELTVEFAKNLADGRVTLDAFRGQLVELTSNGRVAADVDGFTEGVGKFAVDLAVALPKLEATIARALVSGENVWDAVKAEAGALWQSFEKNILANPEFWVVAGVIAKGLAAATAVLSGGTLSFVALGLMLLSEVDARTNFVAELVGKDAAPWVKLGIGVATALCLGIGAATGNAQGLIPGLNTGVGLLNGAGQVYQGYQAIQTADQRADELEREAALTQTLNRMQQLHRLIETLLGELSEQSEDRTTVREIGSEIAQTQAATQGALIMRA